MVINEKDSYGLLGTLLWFLLIAGIFLLIQTLVVGIYAGATQSVSSMSTPEEIEATIVKIALNGNVVAWAGIASGFVCTLLVLLAAKLKKGVSVRAYLALIQTDKSTYIKWGIVFAFILLLTEGVTYLLGKESSPTVIVNIYQSASPKWFLWLALVIAAPIFEEVFFRGFLYKGLTNSFMGLYGGIIVTAAIWASIHVQYEAYYIAYIFVWGIVFGYIRHKTGSLYIPIFLHVLTNTIATLQAHLVQVS